MIFSTRWSHPPKLVLGAPGRCYCAATHNLQKIRLFRRRYMMNSSNSKKSSASRNSSSASSSSAAAVDVGVTSFSFGRCRACAFAAAAALLLSPHIANAFSIAPPPSRRNHVAQSRGSHRSSSSGDLIERRRGLFGQPGAMSRDQEGSRRHRAPLRSTAKPQEPPYAVVDDGASLGQQVRGFAALWPVGCVGGKADSLLLANNVVVLKYG